MQTLAFDYLIEPLGMDRNGEVMFISARKITTYCEFKCESCCALSIFVFALYKVKLLARSSFIVEAAFSPHSYLEYYFLAWEVLTSDFHFKDIEYEDNVVLKSHEPHYHTAS